MASAFDVELPFPIRKSRRSRLSVGDVKVYSDIALAKGHAGKGLHGARDVFRVGAVEAGKLADIMRQVDVSAMGSLRRHDFFLALDRAGVSLPMEDTDNLFRALASANRGRGCDIEMFAHLVNFWARNNRSKTPVTLALSGHQLPSERTPSHISQTEHALPALKAPGSDSFDAACRTSHEAALRDLTAGEGDISDGGGSGNDRENGNNGSPNGRFSPTLDGRSDGRCATPEAECGAAVAGRRNSFAVTINDIFNSSPARDGRTYAPRHDRVDAPEFAPAAGHSLGTPTELPWEHGQGGAGDGRVNGRDDAWCNAGGDARGDARGNAQGNARSSAARALVLDAGVARAEEAKAPDEAYMHSLGYGNLGSLLPILLDRRAALEASLERLDRGGTGRVRPGDFMAAVRQVGIALSVVQEGNMMDLLERMGALTVGEEGSDWVNAKAGVAAIALAGEKAGGRSFQAQEKPRSFLEEGTRLLDAVSDHYADVHLSLLPSFILLGPNALRERRSAADDGAGNVFVTAGSLRKALRHAGVLLGDTDDRVLWRLLLRRAQVVHGRDKRNDNEHARREDTSRFLERGIIPLPLLDDVMGFNADEALRIRRQLQQKEARPATSVSAPYRDHLGPWAAPIAQSNVQHGGGDVDDAPLLLQKARLRVEGLGDTVAERSQALVAYLPKLGPTGERQTLPRRELTRLLQELRVGVRSGELQNLWYHMDRNKVSREGFRSILLEAKDSVHVTFPAPPCPCPTGPVTPNSHVSYSGDSTPVGGVSVSGARLQRVLNQAAYEENMRRAAGSALTYGVPEIKESGKALASSPSRPSSKDSLPVLLERAVKRVRDLDNGQAAVFALVPDMGRAKEGMRITRGGIQRVLHGLGVVPRSGELQQLWWFLEKGVVGDPRVTVEGFRDVLLGRVTKLALLPDWTAQNDTRRGHHQDQRSSKTLDGEDNGCESPGTGVLREVRTALGLVRRRVRGVIRGCEDRDLTADGWVTEEAFLAVLRDQGILQQLGNAGLSALRQAVGVDACEDKKSAPTAVVRYTGLVGAIDSYLDTVISWDTADVALRLGSGEQAHEDDRGIAIQTSPTRHSHGSPNGGEVDRGSPTPLVETPICPVSAKKMVDVTVSQNSVARAARGWDDDPPVAPLGMRHFPHKNCSVATLVGGRVFSDRAATKNKVEHERERRPLTGGVGVSTGMMGALHWRDTAPVPSKPANLASPRQSPVAASGTSPCPSWRRGNDASAPDCSPTPTDPQQSGSGHKNRSAGRNLFVPTGGDSGLGRPAWSSGRRGFEGGVGGLTGGGVSRAICWEGGEKSEDRQEDMAGSPVAVGDDSDDRCNSPGKRSNVDHRDGRDERGATPEVAGGEYGHMKVHLSSRRSGQSNMGKTREVTEAWAENADHRTDSANADTGTTMHRAVFRPGIGKNPREISESRKSAAKALLSDRALLAGVFRQLAGVGGPQAQDGLDRAGMVQLLRYPRLPSRLSEEQAEDLADAVLDHCGSSTVRFPSLTAFLAKSAGSINAPLSTPYEGVPVERGSRDHAWDVAASRQTRSLGEDPIAQSIKRNIQHGRSELRLAGEDAEGRLSCAVHLRRAFRKRRKNLGGDPGGIDDCSVGASDLPGVLQDMGVMLNPTEAAFLIKKCRVQSTPGRRAATGGFDEAPVRAGDVLGFFTELLSAH